MDEVTTATVSIETALQSIPDVLSAFGGGALAGFAALFAALLLVSRVGPLVQFLDGTKADWVVWVVRAVATLGGAVVAALLMDFSVMAAVGGALGAAIPVVSFVQRAVKEAQD